MNQRTTRKDAGGLAKFRKLPGARLAVAAFLVTVAVGLGGPPAYAWWSQQGDARITATAGAAKPLVAPVLACKRDPRQQGSNGSQDTQVSWTSNGAPATSSYLMNFTVLTPNGKTPQASRSYLLPWQATSEIRLTDLPGLNDWFAGEGGNNDKFSVTVRNVWIEPPVKFASLIQQSEALRYSAAPGSQSLEMQFKGNKEGYHC